MRAIILGALMLAIAGCITPYNAEATLFPANESARTIGALRATYRVDGTQSGIFTLTMPDGEVLSGRYSVNLGGATSWGALYGSMYGPQGAAFGSAAASSTSIENSSPATADAVGPSGTTVHCETMNNNITGHGNGACELSNGARFRVQY